MRFVEEVGEGMADGRADIFNADHLRDRLVQPIAEACFLLTLGADGGIA